MMALLRISDMKKGNHLLLAFVALLCCTVADAVPAWPGLQRVLQPDGSQVTLQIDR